ncbi:MAG: DUF4440 domain-containing protein [Gemmatimonadota bacterium]
MSLPAIEVPADFADLLRAYERAYASRDSAALAALFAADGFLLRPGAPVQRGGPTIAATLAAEGGALALVPLAFERADSAGFIIGTFGAEKGPTRGGKFMLALTRRASGAAGAWRIAADMDSPNAR